ncbi:MAG: hypothetical protein N4A61_15645 [Pelagimonas sp.]|jgi:hypothetical protein|nr:hypothetical protein [Pelagimonas sp.]
MTLAAVPERLFAENCPSEMDRPESHEAVSHFYNADFASFFDTIGPTNAGLETTNEILERLTQTFKTRFKECASLEVTRHSENFTSEFLAFSPEDGPVVFLILRSVKLSGEWSTVQYYLSTSFTEALEVWGL